jgi:hypothetical protein
MGEIIEIYQNTVGFIPLFWDSEYINLSITKTLTFTAWTTQAFDMGIRWSNDGVTVIDTDVESVLANNMNSITVSTKTRYAQFFLLNIAAPSDIQTQAFFYTD